LTAPIEDPDDQTIAELAGRLAEDARAYARAEIVLLQQIARRRADKAKSGAVLLAVGAALALSSLIALIVGAVIELARYMSPILAGILVALILAAVGGVLIKIGVDGLGALGGDEDERRAIARGERAP